ncbi:hypothetical protein SAMN05661096_03580 [Marivirga sericea]|uniref:Serine aminopeptidase S33 domain-containing protein n=1 Tax=Marivirga sericea TaxID=1028 RepID=A0A1X7L7H5_9BACT|nr:alpha/beta fold hydrolase [Marivirga sericea]SMG49202.1 hypothetical protein SAMN05661096_03580 [Marivirga sericea]
MKHLIILLFLVITLYPLTAQDIKIGPRPQEPTEPYPYFSEDIMFQNKEANITLSGTLTLPNGQTDFPIVVLISGSSAHNRNQEVAGHKPFLVIADYLTSNGIGVLRYDDRGVGQSEGEYEIAAYAEIASDVESAVAYLKSRKDVNSKKIGLIGHSGGGLIAPLVASRRKDISFIVMMAAPAIPGYELILLQTETLNKAKGISDDKTQVELAFYESIFSAVIESSDLDETRSDLSASFKAQPESLPEEVKVEDVNKILQIFTAAWFQNFLQYDPSVALEQVDCPVLAINGAKDLQIPGEENLDAIKLALDKGGNDMVTIKKMPKLNHLFQEADTGLPDEYSTIEQTFSPLALEEIEAWIKLQTKE